MQKNFFKMNKFISKEIYDELLRFQYFIIIPEKDREKPVIGTVFNRFDENIVNSILFFNFISTLPSHYDELTKPWPLSSIRLNLTDGYSIRFLSEENLDISMINIINSYPLSTVLISSEITEKSLKKIQGHILAPIITFDSKDPYYLNSNNLKDLLFIKWNQNFEQILGYELPKPTYNDFPSFDAHPANYVVPLSKGIDILRGIDLKRNSKPTDQVVHIDEEEKREEIFRVLKILIVEKYLIHLLVLSSEKKLTEKKLEQIKVHNLTGEELYNLATYPQPNAYLFLRDKILNSFEKLNFFTDSVLCVPSINVHLLKKTNQLLKKDQIPNKILKYFYNANAYNYHIYKNDLISNKEKESMSALIALADERTKEITLLSNISYMYALGKCLPYIRTQNIPSQQLQILAEAMQNLYKGVVERNKQNKFIAKMKEYQIYLTDLLDSNTVQTTLKHSKHLKVISDLPIEWFLTDGIPLCLEKSYSRVPITPGDNLILHSYNQTQAHTIVKNNFKILILNTLNKNDILYSYGLDLKNNIDRNLTEISSVTIYEEIESKEKFKSEIETIKPDILIYYGHGEFDLKSGEGMLLIGSEKMYAREILNIKHSPLITILGACETQVLHGTHLNTASLFLGNMSVSVIGSFLAVDGLTTRNFIIYLLTNLSDALKKNSNILWSDIILKSLREVYMRQPLEFLRSKHPHILNIHLNNETDLNLEKDLCFKIDDDFENRDKKNVLKNRLKIYKEYFKNNQELLDVITNLSESINFIEESLFYTSLGSPELIKIGK